MHTNSAVSQQRLREELTSRGSSTRTRTNSLPRTSVPFNAMDVIDEAFNVVYVANVPAAEVTNGLSIAMFTVSDTKHPQKAGQTQRVQDVSDALYM